MKATYLEIMESALRAYPRAHIEAYFSRVKSEGLTEHGFPRLTANIGILMAHGKRRDLMELFLEMMDFCCREMPNRKCANDFSIKEIILALLEIEKAGLVDAARCQQWRRDLATANAMETYNCIAPAPNVRIGNWAAYAAASEFMRGYIGLTDPTDFLNLQVPSQLLSFDENGMYRDPHEPMLYDLATRCQLAVLLHFGYSGPLADELDGYLRKAGLLTLKMQSVTGEIPFGGRSNQFLFNEAYLAAVCEFEAARYAREGDKELASQFKTAADLAAQVILRWIGVCEGQRHVKNRYPLDSSFGCEGYGYFDKYMITLASFSYLAYLYADDDIPCGVCPAMRGGYTARTSDYSHKFFAACGGYQLEIDWNADPHYDGTGLGRVHYAGAPSALALSVPFTQEPVYTIDRPNLRPLSLCGGVKTEKGWRLACEENSLRDIRVTEETERRVAFTVTWDVNGRVLTEEYAVTADGVDVTVRGAGEICYALPAFAFDGKEHPARHADAQTLTVDYRGWRYTANTDGALIDSGEEYQNRNGCYQLYLAAGREQLKLHLALHQAE
ncbi:MAG: hypothetical protein SOX25_10255 [Eubacteriales bacterium]|nr:hypothetical protein [Eubacteriales bacterium]